MVRALLIAWSGSMLIGSFIGIAALAAGGGALGLLVYQAPWVVGGAILGYLAGADVAKEMLDTGLKNLTIQGQIKEFYDAYGQLLLATLILLTVEVSFATGALP